MAIFRFEALRANHGDSILLQWGAEPDALNTALIDGGAGRTYEDVLIDRLHALRKVGESAPNLKFMMLSHVDDDHVRGLLKLTADMIEADDIHAPRPVEVDELWHNSFPDAVAELEFAANTDRDAITASASLIDLGINPNNECGASLVLSSIGQGRRLRDDANRLGIELNPPTDGELILRGEKVTRSGLHMHVLGPGQGEVDDLRERWKIDLKKILDKESEQELREAARRLDRSVTNLASLVVLASFEGVETLLTGDARGDAILRWLELEGFLTSPDQVFHIQILKIMHHGSIRNVPEGFFDRVTADHYVFSGDGNHGNPEPETVKAVLDSRGDPALGDSYALHFTYDLDEMEEDDDFDRAEFERVLNDKPWAREVCKFPAPEENGVTLVFENGTLTERPS